MTEVRKPIPRPLPKPDIYVETKPFWQAAKRHELLLQYDTEAGKFQWFPRPVSIYSGKRTLEWRAASGKGRLYTWTLSHIGWPGHADRVPYMCALVELEEGVRMLANLVNYQGVELRDGLPVRLVWEALSDEFEYPQFEPA
jgi:uncharacterized protein